MIAQPSLFGDVEPAPSLTHRSGSFVDNMKLPVHRWFRYSAGFSAQWVESLVAEHAARGSVTVLDPFAGSGTTLVAASQQHADSHGVESHPFVFRVAQAKLRFASDPEAFRAKARAILDHAEEVPPPSEAPPELLIRCFSESHLTELDRLRQSWLDLDDGSPASELAWLALVSILRSVSHVGTAPWQYLLPSRTKKSVLTPRAAFRLATDSMIRDMHAVRPSGARTSLHLSDARTCEGVDDRSISLVITSPPYANNYDYADATRLEMTFLREIEGWSDLQRAVRKHLLRSCSQHVSDKSTSLEDTLRDPMLAPISDEINDVCAELARVRLTKGGKKAYHLMVACYFADMARVWQALRRVCLPAASVYMVLGDSAPYGVYVPVVEWNAKLAREAGFDRWKFEKIRDRNLKWKNRKHRVPLCEGRLLVQGERNG